MSCTHNTWGICELSKHDCNFPHPICSNYCNIDTSERLNINQKSTPHKDYYRNEFSFGYRFVLTLILGYLGKLDSIAIIDCENPEEYFKEKVDLVFVPELRRAVNKTRDYVFASKDAKLAEGMDKFNNWIKELGNHTPKIKELTITEIEERLGYKIKIIGEDNEN